MSDWLARRLGDCATFLSGGTPSKSRTEFWGGDLPWITAKDMKSFRLRAAEDRLTPDGSKSGTRIVEAGTSLMLVRGMTLHSDVPIGVTQVRAAFNQDIKALVARDPVDPAFLPYLLVANKPRLLGLVDSASHGTGRIHSYLLADLLVSAPPLGEQRAIAAALGDLDDLDEALRSDVRLLEEAIAARLRAARAEGTWESRSVASLARFVNGGAFTKGAGGSGRMVIRIRELNSGPSESTVYSDREVPADNEGNAGDILFSWSGTLGIFRWRGPNAIINQHIFKVVPNVPAWLVFARLHDVLPAFQGIARDKATTMGHIQRHHLEDAKVDVPTGDTLTALDAELRPLWDLILATEAEAEQLAKIRNRLVSDLVLGGARLAVPTTEAA